MSQHITQQVAKISGDSEHDLQFQIVAEDDIPIINQNQTKINSFELENHVMYIRFQNFEEAHLVHQAKQLLVQLLTSQETEALKLLKTFEEVMLFAQGKHYLRATFVHLHRAIKVNDLQPLEQIHSSLNRPFYAALTAPKIPPAPILDANKTTLHFNNPLKPTLLAIADVSLACQEPMHYEVLKQDIRQVFFKVRQLYNMSIYFDIDHLEANREQCIATFLLESPNRGTITGQVFVRAANAIPILQTFRVFPVQSPIRPPLPGEQLFQSPTGKKISEQARQYLGTIVDRVPQSQHLALVASGLTYYDVQFKYERLRQLIKRDTGIDVCILVRTYELPAEQTKPITNAKGATADVRSTQHYPMLLLMIYGNSDEEVTTIRTTYGMGRRSETNTDADAVKYIYLDEKSTIVVYLGTDIVSHHNLRYNTLFKVNGYVLDGLNIAALPHLGQIIRDSPMIAAELTNPQLAAVYPALSFHANASGEVNPGLFGIHFVFTNSYSIPVTRELDPLVKTLHLVDENGRPVSQVTYARFDNAYKKLPKHMQPRHMLTTLKFNGRIPPQLKPSHVHEAKKTYAPKETQQVFTPVGDAASYLSRLTANTNELPPLPPPPVPQENVVHGTATASLPTSANVHRRANNNIYNEFPMDEVEEPDDNIVEPTPLSSASLHHPPVRSSLSSGGINVQTATQHHHQSLHPSSTVSPPAVTAPEIRSPPLSTLTGGQRQQFPLRVSSVTASTVPSLATTAEDRTVQPAPEPLPQHFTSGGPTQKQLQQLLDESLNDLRQALASGLSGTGEMEVLREVQALIEWQNRNEAAVAQPERAPAPMRSRVLRDLRKWGEQMRRSGNLYMTPDEQAREEAVQAAHEQAHQRQLQSPTAPWHEQARLLETEQRTDPDYHDYLLSQVTLATGAGGYTQSQRSAALVHPERTSTPLTTQSAVDADIIAHSQHLASPVYTRRDPAIPVYTRRELHTAYQPQSSQGTLATGAGGLTQLDSVADPVANTHPWPSSVHTASHSIEDTDAGTATVLVALAQQETGESRLEPPFPSLCIYPASSPEGACESKRTVSPSKETISIMVPAVAKSIDGVKPLTAKQRKAADVQAKQLAMEAKVSSDQATKAARLTATPKVAEKLSPTAQGDKAEDSDSSITTPGSQSLLFPIFHSPTASSGVPMDVQADSCPRGTKRDLEKHTIQHSK